MENDYTSPNEMIEMFENIILTCQEWIKVVVDAKGTEQERKVMEEFKVYYSKLHNFITK